MVKQNPTYGNGNVRVSVPMVLACDQTIVSDPGLQVQEFVSSKLQPRGFCMYKNFSLTM
jgi:hypothetical protein